MLHLLLTFPFETSDFLDVFSAYNTFVWPGQLILVGLASLAVFFAAVGTNRNAIMPVVILVLLWVWSGVVYHMMFFTRINIAANVFGLLFLVNAALLGVAFAGGQIKLGFHSSLRAWAGIALMGYALIGYQYTTIIFGHVYPSTPTFGAPCPLVIFTFGLLLWNEKPTPWYVIAIPMAWAVVGTVGAVTLGMTEDLALPLSAVLFAALAYGPISVAAGPPPSHARSLS